MQQITLIKRVEVGEMLSLNYEEWKSWLERNGYFYEQGLAFSRPSREILSRVPVPNEPGDLPNFIDDLVEFDGYKGQRLLWISEWRIWSAVEYGLRHLSMLTGRPVKDADAPDFHCYLFEESEWENVMPMLVVPLLYGWDAYLLVEGGETLVKISHESRVSFSILEESEIDVRRLPRWREPTHLGLEN